MSLSYASAQFAEQLAIAVAPLVAVLHLGAGARETGFMQAAQTLPFLLFSLPAGVLADRYRRVPIMIVAECTRAVSLFALIGLYRLHALSVVWLSLLGFLGASGTVAYMVCAPALVQMLVRPSDRPAANGRLELCRSFAFLCGPAITGYEVNVGGGGVAFALAATLSATAVGLSLRIREVVTNGASMKTSASADLRDGMRFLLEEPLLYAVARTTVAFNLAFFRLQSAYVAYAVQHLGYSASQIGSSLGIVGFGALGGALLSSRVLRRLPFGAAMLVGPACGIIAMARLLATLVFPAYWLILSGFFLFGFGGVIWTISSNSLRQSLMPTPIFGRVSSIMLMMAFGSRPIGSLIGGLVAFRFGYAVWMIVVVALFALQFLNLALSSVSRLLVLPARESDEARHGISRVRCSNSLV